MKGPRALGWALAAAATTVTLVAAASLSAQAASAQAADVPRALRTRNVVLIVVDGMRWQEIFGGADSALLRGAHGQVDDTTALVRDFWRADVEARRAALLPFFWGEIAGHGQLYGNRERGDSAAVTNGLKFSYPGYNEMLTGRPDSRIHSNAAGPNPNVTVFEWLARRPGFRGRVAAFGTWSVFADIFNRARSGLPVFAGWEPPFADVKRPTPAEAQLDALYRTTTRMWDDVAWDAFGHAAVLDYLRTHRPHALFVGYGETDEWAHDVRYDHYLRAAHQVDAFVAELWRTMQALPEYHDRTTFIITADHGRGRRIEDWGDHDRNVPGAEEIWLAVLGPDTPARGEHPDAGCITQSQIAATVAALLGEDWRRAEPAAAPPIGAVLGR
jgi:Sulfatase